MHEEELLVPINWRIMIHTVFVVGMFVQHLLVPLTHGSNWPKETKNVAAFVGICRKHCFYSEIFHM